MTNKDKNKNIVIGGASGFWGDAARATPQLLEDGRVNYIVYDYLAEITMSIMARARAKQADHGYALDFVGVAMAKNLKRIAEQGVKIISNAGGVNPLACTQALRAVIEKQGLNLKVACVVGDDLIEQATELVNANHREMFTDAAMPQADQLQSINAYLGAFPIAKALDLGADIVITGRCVDSAVTLGACIHEFGWQADDLDKLAMGSLAGHILECGPQATGGNFTDWQQVADQIHEIGYPIAEVSSDGDFVCSKPENTGGLVSVGTVAEQMVYEIGDPQAYYLPDVVCDFSEVSLQEIGKDRVQVRGAKGRKVPENYKVCATYTDGFRGGTFLNFYGIDADKKARALADAVFAAARREFDKLGLPDFEETSTELLGTESQYGAFSQVTGAREVAMKIAAKHSQAAGIGIMLREAVGVGLATPPGLASFQGGRPKPSPVVRLFSFELPKDVVSIFIDVEGQLQAFTAPHTSVQESLATQHSPPSVPSAGDMCTVQLVELAWARSGDKGNKANVGVIARKPEFYPYIVDALTEEVIEVRFSHFLSDTEAPDASPAVPKKVERFLMPGSNAINFLMHAVLGGGGVASLRNDAQGKGYSQLVLDIPITIPSDLL